MKGESAGDELVFVPYQKGVPFSVDPDGSLGFVCLQCATASSPEKRCNVAKKKEIRDAGAAADCFSGTSAQRMKSTLYTVLANIAEHFFTAVLLWRTHRSYIIGFYGSLI